MPAALARLLAADGMAAARALAELVETAEQAELAASLLHVAARDGLDGRLCCAMVEQEFDVHAEHPVQVLRTKSLRTRVLSHHARVVGEDYLIRVLEGPVRHLVEQGVEIHTDMGSASPDEVQENLERLEQWSAEFVDAVCSKASVDAIPPSMRAVCATMLGASERLGLGENMSTALIGGYLVLRFICPALVTPKSVLEQSFLEQGVAIHAQCHRTLILVAKVLQAAANNKTLDSDDELYPLSSHINHLHTQLRAFLLSTGRNPPALRPMPQEWISKFGTADPLYRALWKYRESISSHPATTSEVRAFLQQVNASSLSKEARSVGKGSVKTASGHKTKSHRSAFSKVLTVFGVKRHLSTKETASSVNGGVGRRGEANPSSDKVAVAVSVSGGDSGQGEAAISGQVANAAVAEAADTLEKSAHSVGAREGISLETATSGVTGVGDATLQGMNGDEHVCLEKEASREDRGEKLIVNFPTYSKHGVKSKEVLGHTANGARGTEKVVVEEGATVSSNTEVGVVRSEEIVVEKETYCTDKGEPREELEQATISAGEAGKLSVEKVTNASGSAEVEEVRLRTLRDDVVTAGGAETVLKKRSVVLSEDGCNDLLSKGATSADALRIHSPACGVGAVGASFASTLAEPEAFVHGDQLSGWATGGEFQDRSSEKVSVQGQPSSGGNRQSKQPTNEFAAKIKQLLSLLSCAQPR